jgi:hypothetical protein
MKFNMLNLIVAVVIFTVIVGTLMCSCTVVKPYSESTIFSKQFNYEGFGDMEYVNGAGELAGDNKSNVHLISGQNAECSKVYGFDGLFCKPYAADKTVDVFSQVDGSADCIGNSSSLHNSKGGLCLDKNLTALLQTRGGNQTGAAYQIGK